MQRGKN